MSLDQADKKSRFLGQIIQFKSALESRQVEIVISKNWPFSPQQSNRAVLLHHGSKLEIERLSLNLKLAKRCS